MMKWFPAIEIGPALVLAAAWFTGWWLRRHPDYCEWYGDICPANPYRCPLRADDKCDGLKGGHNADA